MLKLLVFLVFFFAAFFVPAWPLLLLVGLLYLIAWLLPGEANVRAMMEMNRPQTHLPPRPAAAGRISREPPGG